MKKGYVLRHWILTLLVAPFTFQGIELVFGKDPHQIVGLLEIYPITLLFSIAFSLPTFLVYILCFHFLSRQKIKPALSKLILISASVLGIFITLTIIKGSMSKNIIITYTLTSVIIGLLLKLKEAKATNPDNNKLQTE